MESCDHRLGLVFIFILFLGFSHMEGRGVLRDTPLERLIWCLEIKVLPLEMLLQQGKRILLF